MFYVHVNTHMEKRIIRTGVVMMKSHNTLSVAVELGGWDGGSVQVTWITSICSH